MSDALHSPGTLVSARGREWIVLGGSDADVLCVRPVSGGESDVTRICIPLEEEPVRPARFSLPSATPLASHDAALLLRDALMLSLRRGAGPFRSFGHIAVEPRAYQLVPLLMALKLDPVRLLVADDVGVGKTIEAGLVARELLDRGDVDRMTVLCPPHLVDQWVRELEERFHLRAVGVTAASASRLERDLPPTTSLFQAHPYTVVSLDYIKAEKRRDNFRTHCPELVIVDEAHTCAATSSGRHQRYELLRGLAAAPNRHLVLLTATPHSGDDAAFYRLLGLLDPAFQNLDREGPEHARLRERLGAHFVQRRRPDIEEWQQGGGVFPRRQTTEVTYRLTGRWLSFLTDVIDYCGRVVAASAEDGRRRQLGFWGTLALMRCASSSPVAALLALRNRGGLDTAPEARDELLDQIFDGTADDLEADDVEPAAGSEDPELDALIERAKALAGAKGDPKLERLTAHVRKLLVDGFSPVVFCRYIATAHYIARHLEQAVDAAIVAVTGESSAAEREERVAQLAAEERAYVLVATDCLSEGINLQESFDAVVHYDLSWNPTRHEQREGRVDRFGQKSPFVRATLMYGADNPVDGAVLNVILRKAEAIRRDLGVRVPVPEDEHALSQALVEAVLRRHLEATRQAPLPFDRPSAKADKSPGEEVWTDAGADARQTRTIFAQRRLAPKDVLPEWQRTLAALGGRDEVHRFVERALSRLGSGLSPLKNGWQVPLAPLPEDLRDRLEVEGLTGTLAIDFGYPPRGRSCAVRRSHPLVTVLAEGLLERTLAGADAADPGALGRVGCWISSEVPVRTVVALLRLRHELTVTERGRTRSLLVEEASALAWAGSDGMPSAEGDVALALLVPAAAGDPPPIVRERTVAAALDQLRARDEVLAAFARRRADALLADHERVRESSRARSTQTTVQPLLPPDVVGLFVLLPRVA